MGKIPVGTTIQNAYTFLIRDFLNILGIVWAPLVVSIAIGLMMTPGFFHGSAAATEDEASRYTLRMLPLALLALLPIRAMIANGVMELALGMRRGPTYVYFSLGAAIWRFVAAWVLLFLAMLVLFIGLMIVLVIGGLILTFALKGIGPGNAVGIGLAIGFGAAVIVWAFCIFIGVRLTFFLPAVVVAEKKIDLGRGWTLTHGNFWRIFVIGLAVALPLLIAFWIYAFIIYAPALGELHTAMQLIRSGAAQDVTQQHMEAFGAAIRARSLAVWPINAVVQFVLGVIAYGLLYGASAFAYRAIQPTAPVIV